MWRERTTILPIGAELTVEPANYEPPADGTIEAVVGSFRAQVESGDGEYREGADVEYTVCSFDGQVFKVRRSQLRHRKWHRIA